MALEILVTATRVEDRLQLADYGLVADLAQALPELQAKPMG